MYILETGERKLDSSIDAFERFAVRFFRDYIKETNQEMTIIRNSDLSNYVLFFPNGFEEIKRPTYIVIKSMDDYTSMIYDLEIVLTKHFKTNYYYIYLINSSEFNYQIEELKSELKSRNLCDIWDLNTLKKISNKYFSKHNYLILNPEKTLINNFEKYY